MSLPQIKSRSLESQAWALYHLAPKSLGRIGTWMGEDQTLGKMSPKLCPMSGVFGLCGRTPGRRVSKPSNLKQKPKQGVVEVREEETGSCGVPCRCGVWSAGDEAGICSWAPDGKGHLGATPRCQNSALEAAGSHGVLEVGNRLVLAAVGRRSGQEWEGGRTGGVRHHISLGGRGYGRTSSPPSVSSFLSLPF